MVESRVRVALWSFFNVMYSRIHDLYLVYNTWNYFWGTLIIIFFSKFFSFTKFLYDIFFPEIPKIDKNRRWRYRFTNEIKSPKSCRYQCRSRTISVIVPLFDIHQWFKCVLCSVWLGRSMISNVEQYYIIYSYPL